MTALMRNTPAKKVWRQVASWRRPIATWLVLFTLAVVGVNVGAQVIGFAKWWPVLYEMSESLVVKRGVNAQGANSDLLFFRIGWGPCLAIRTGEWQTLVDDSPSDRYMNLRQYGDSLVREASQVDNFSANCPRAPLEVKPYWRGSRPTYFHEYDATLSLWIKGPKSKYRITTATLADCLPYNAKKTNGNSSNYWRLADNAEVYSGTETFLVGDLPLQLVTVCRDKDVPIGDYRW